MSKSTQQEDEYIEQYECLMCKINKPKIFFGATNGAMNSICNKCKVLHKPIRIYEHHSVLYDKARRLE